MQGETSSFRCPSCRAANATAVDGWLDGNVAVGEASWLCNDCEHRWPRSTPTPSEPTDVLNDAWERSVLDNSDGSYKPSAKALRAYDVCDDELRKGLWLRLYDTRHVLRARLAACEGDEASKLSDTDNGERQAEVERVARYLHSRKPTCHWYELSEHSQDVFICEALAILNAARGGG